MKRALPARPPRASNSAVMWLTSGGEGAGAAPSFDIAEALPLLVAALFAALIQSLWIPLDSDVSWLLTVCDRLLAGDQLYVDIVEVNPPASVWLYLPFVWAAHGLDIRPEALVAAAFILGAIVSALATAKLASRIEGAPRPPALFAILGFVTLVLPMGLFAQREHAALMLAIPSLAALARTADGRPPGRRALAVAGIAAGLVVIIKPYLALAILIPALWGIAHRRSLRPFRLPMATGGATAALYGAAVLIFTPDYLRWIPIFAHTYLSIQAPPDKLLFSALLFLAAVLLPTLLLWRTRVSSLTVVWALGAAGFVLAGVLQGKNYGNHWLPGAALALAAAFSAATSAYARERMQVLVTLLLAAVGLWQLPQWSFRPDPAVAEALLRVAPRAPTMMALSRELSSGHPVTRNIGGRWVASRASLFTAAAARSKGLDDALARRSYAEDLASFAADVGTRKPAVILVDRPDKAWLLNEPTIAREMAHYSRVESVGNTEIWLRK